MLNFNSFDLNLLVVLDALLTERSVTRAAAKLHMTQPATSAALARLRRQLGDEILVRDGRSLRPTVYAMSLEGPVHEMLIELEVTLNSNPTFDPSRDERTFRVSASDYSALLVLRPLAARLHEIAPGVKLSVTGVTRAVPHQLIRDEVDLGIIPSEVVDIPSEVQSHPLFSDEYVCAVWRDNPDVGDTLTVDDLRTLPGLGYSANPVVDFAEIEMQAAGVQRNIEFTTASFAMAPLLIRGTRMISFVHRRLGHQLAEAAELRLLESPIEIAPIHEMMLWHRRYEDDPAHRWFREELVGLVHELGM